MSELYLSERHREQVLALIRQHVPMAEILVYGSRVTGRSHDGSDLDIALRLGQGVPISREAMAALREAFAESTLPFLVDIRDWSCLPETFHQEIERRYVFL